MSALASAQYVSYQNTDPRFIENGSELPSETYADQPYVVVCDDGSWLCTMTTSAGTEGAHMNHIIATKSYDKGKTWTYPVNVEPPGMPQSSWAVPLKIPGGRIYVFYNYNEFGFNGVEGVNSGPLAFKYSDDHGKTWSDKRYKVPIRKTKIDEENHTRGQYQFFWSIDKPVVTDKGAYIALSKILRTSPDDRNWLAGAEGFLLKTENILTENNPDKIRWKTLPEGDRGIWNPDMDFVQAEHNMEIMSNGNLYVVYRTWEGFPAYAISTDDGKTFSMPERMRYANGDPMGNTRACPKIYKTKEGKYLFWYHNNFNKKTYHGRNPAWLSGGVEKDGEIAWSQPEIVLYARDPAISGMSYPDFIEQDGQLWITETQKVEARVHKIDQDLVQGMWNQGNDATVVRKGLVMDSDESMLQARMINFPHLPDLIEGGGFSIELWLTANEIQSGQQILKTLGQKNKGIEIFLAEKNAIKISVNDGQRRERNLGDAKEFVSDENTIKNGNHHHVVFTIDGAAKIATIVVDGILSDGGESRTHGWGKVYPLLSGLNDTYKGTISEDFKGRIHHMRVYNRALRTSEAIANYHSGLKQNELNK